MLKNIAIDNFGSYQGFNGLADQYHFKKLNLIYGTNYSGKTTLSRIIKSLEKGILPENYDSPKFKLIFENHEHNESSIQGVLNDVMVFNKDYINENLSFLLVNNHDKGSIKSFDAIIIGQDQIEINKKLKNLEESQAIQVNIFNNLNEIVETLNAQITEIRFRIGKANEDKSKKLTNKARQLDELKLTPKQRTYTRTHLIADIDELCKASSIKRNFSEADILKKLNDMNVNKKPINNFNDKSDEIQKSIYDHLEVIEKNFNEKFTRSETKTLDQNFKDWIIQGYNLHREHNQQQCQFCENFLPENLIKNYELFLNNKDELFIRNLIELKYKNDKIIKAFDSNIDNLPSGNNHFYDSFLSICESHINELKSILINIKLDLKTIDELLDKKIENTDFIFTFDFLKTKKQIELFIETYKKYVAVCADNDSFTNNIEQNQDKIRREILIEKIIDFLCESDWFNVNKNILEFENQIDNLDCLKKYIDEQKEFNYYCSVNITLQLSELIAQKSTKKAAINLINKFLNSFFGHEHLSLVPFNEEDTSNHAFKIVRNGLDAYNLSEGECTLVAFCYFISVIHNLKSIDKLKDYIVYIDDPISSLDSNNIFYIFSLIETVICHKVNYKQLFISTHNLEFFKYIRKLELPTKKVKSCQQAGCTATKHNNAEDVGYYFITKRNNLSIIEKLPHYLKKYNTEFNYLFSQIWNCAQATELLGIDQIYSVANNMRKFLEVYNYFKYPSDVNKSKYRQKFFDADNNMNHFKLIDRIINEYSHTEEIFDRTMVPVTSQEIILASKFLLTRLEYNDKDQYDGLVQSINDLKSDVS